MRGTLTNTVCEGVTVHTYTAPSEGWTVNSHIIELADQLIAIDAQYMMTFAAEVVDFAGTVGKPITRLYITHFHPDHLLGAAAFNVPIYALPEVAAKIQVIGDVIAREEHEKHSSAIPDHAKIPSETVLPGEEMIGGTPFIFMELRHAETEHALVVGLPRQGILITQDLLYNRVHVFLGEKSFATWHEALDLYETFPYVNILPGHGAPGGKELFGQMREYLTLAKKEYLANDTAEGFVQRMRASFPGFDGDVLLHHQLRFLFPKK